MWLALATVLFGLSTPAFAQDEVEKLNEDGIRAFQEQRFTDAADKFRQAYDLAPEPTLKKNEAIAWFKGGDCENAVKAARTYLGEEGQDEASQKEAQSVVARCSVQIARQQMESGELAEAESTLAQTAGIAVDEEAATEISRARQELERLEAEEAARLQAEREAEERRQREAALAEQAEGQKNLGYILTGTGAGIVLAGLAYHIAILATTVPEYRRVGEEGQDRERFDTLGNRIATARWLVPTLYAIGGSTAGVGVYFLVSAPEASTQPTAANAHHTAGVVFHGRF